ncbi:MAG: CRTAC1 family protein [Actinomycetota bacterium]
MSALLVLVSAAALGCSGGGESLEPITPDALPAFVEKGAQVGFVDSQGVRNDAANCLFSKSNLEPLFPDIKEAGIASGLRFNQCLPERMTSGAAAVDVDADGDDDIVFTRLTGHPLLYRNDSTPGEPKFVESTKGSGFDLVDGATNGVGYADIDNDGDKDVVLTGVASRQMYLLVNDGTGKFTEEAVSRGVGMVDNEPHAGQGVSFGDYDLDGWLDMHVNEWQSSIVAKLGVPSHSRLFRNLGAAGKPGVFEDVTESAGARVDSVVDTTWTFSSIFTDFDGDRYPDLAVVADFNTTRFFWNNGDGTFTNGTYDANLGGEENGMGLAVDFHGPDQKPTLFITSIKSLTDCADDSGLVGTGNRLYVYDSERKFADVTDRAGVRDGGWGWGASFIDATNSGSRDLVQASGIDEPWTNPAGCHAKDPVVYWRNDGSDTFDEVAKQVGVVETKPTKATVVFDADNDGRMDILITRDAETPVFFHNVTPTVGRHVDLRVSGTRSNRDALGAIVSVTQTADGPTKKYFVGTTGTYLSQDSSLLRIGLGGGVEPVHRIEVYFPLSEETVVLTDVERNTTVDVVEPDGAKVAGS